MNQNESVKKASRIDWWLDKNKKSQEQEKEVGAAKKFYLKPSIITNIYCSSTKMGASLPGQHAADHLGGGGGVHGQAVGGVPVCGATTRAGNTVQQSGVGTRASSLCDSTSIVTGQSAAAGSVRTNHGPDSKLLGENSVGQKVKFWNGPASPDNTSRL